MDGEFVFLRGQVCCNAGNFPVFAVQEVPDNRVLLQPLVIILEIGLIGGFIGRIGKVDIIRSQRGIDEFRHRLGAFFVVKVRV